LDWQPSKLLSVLEKLDTSTRPLKVLTDQGVALMKYPGNPMGKDALISEFLASELMLCLGIQSPPHGLLAVEERQDPLVGVNLEQGVAFLTQWQEPAFTFSGRIEPLRKLQNPDIVSKLLVFDTWIQNFDRFVLDGMDSTENRDNLLFIPASNGRLTLLVIDHSHAFVETTFEDEMSHDWGEDRRLCGVHPTFATFLRDDEVYRTLDAIRALGDQVLSEIVSQVPVSWGLTTGCREQLVAGLIRRANEMTNWLPQAILDQPSLSFELGNR